MNDCDPDEIVRWGGIGDMTLKTAVRKVMELPADNRRLVMLFRDSGKEPASLDINDIERLAELPAFK